MGTDSVIYIRTDGNSKIATGHLVRCLCIAQALENSGKKVCFLVSDTDSETLLRDLSVSVFQGYSFSFDVKVLETARYNQLELEISELKTLLTKKSVISDSESPTAKKTAISESETILTNKTTISVSETFLPDKPVILVDSYYVTPVYLDSLRKFAKTAYMDDLRSFNYNVDLVINYDVIPPSKEMEYKQAYTNAASALLGAQYTPLRRQFQNQNISLREEIRNILITTGGSDPYHFTETLVSYFLSLNFTFNFHVVVGRLFTNTGALEELAKLNPSVHLHYNVSDMAALMKQCDYAISAAGTTLYELCALGIPAISFTMADNQVIMAETFSETGAIPYAGDIRMELSQNNHNKNNVTSIITEHKKTPVILTRIKKHMGFLSQNPSARIIQQQKMRCLVDGNGAIKIAEALCELYNQHSIPKT